MIEVLIEMRSHWPHFVILFVFLCAFVFGAGPERSLAGILLSIDGLDFAYHYAAKGSFVTGPLDLGHLAITMATVVALLLVALWANRLYPMWMAGAQLISALTFLYQMIPGMAPYSVYFRMGLYSFYFQVGFLALGLAFHVVRRRRLGAYRSWRITQAVLCA